MRNKNYSWTWHRKTWIGIVMVFVLSSFTLPANKDISSMSLFTCEKIYLYCSESDFNLLYAEPRENIYVPVSVKHNSTRWDSVKMRIRGDSSRDFPKKSLKLKFNSARPFMNGRTTINLNAQVLDLSYMRQLLSCYIINESGYPGFKSDPVVLYINDKCIGLYLQVENIDDDYLLANNLDPKNNLFKASRDSSCLSLHDDILKFWEKKTNEDNNFSDLKQLIDSLNLVPDSGYHSFTKRKFEYDRMIHMLALNMMISNTSTYYHNYYMYHDLKNKKWMMLPWDLDNTLENEDVEMIYHTSKPANMRTSDMPGNPFFERAINCQPVLNDIIVKVNYLEQKVFNKERLFPVIDELYKSMLPYFRADSNFINVTHQQWLDQIEDVKAFISNRCNNLRFQFAHAPTAFRVNDAKYRDGKISFNWNSSRDPDGKTVNYKLTYSSDYAYNEEVTKEINGITDTTITVKDSLITGTYYWKIFASDDQFEVPGYERNFLEVK